MVPNAAMLAPKTRPGGVPHRVLGVIFEVFEALGGLGRFGRVLRAVLHGSGRSSKALERLLDVLQRSVGALGEVLGVILGPKMAAKSGSYRQKCCSKRQKLVKRFFDGCCVEDKQPWRPQNLYLSQRILMSNAYRRFHDRQNFWLLLGANMAPCWLP